MQLLEASLQCRGLLLSFRIAGRAAHQHADAPHPLALLRARRERPHRCAAEKRGQEFSSFDVACHVTLRLGVVHAMEGSYHASIARSVTIRVQLTLSFTACSPPTIYSARENVGGCRLARQGSQTSP